MLKIGLISGLLLLNVQRCCVNETLLCPNCFFFTPSNDNFGSQSGERIVLVKLLQYDYTVLAVFNCSPSNENEEKKNSPT